MELVWLVYAISLLAPIGAAAVFGLSLGGFGTVFLWLQVHIDDVKPNIFTWVITVITVLSLFIMVLLPSEKTAYTMVAAYAAQKVAEQPETKDMANDVLTIINSKVKKYAIESAEELEKARKK